MSRGEVSSFICTMNYILCYETNLQLQCALGPRRGPMAPDFVQESKRPQEIHVCKSSSVQDK